MELFLNSASDYKIHDGMGTEYTIEQARTAWEAGKVTEYNMAFNRLMQLNWDMERLKQFFRDAAENWRARNAART